MGRSPPGRQILQKFGCFQVGERPLAAPQNKPKWTTLETFQNQTNRTFGRPWLRFRSILNDLLVNLFVQFHDLAKSLNLQQVQCEMLAFAS